MRSSLRTLAICLLAPAAVSLASEGVPASPATSQDRPSTALGSSQDNPLITHQKVIYGGMKKILLRAAESMPEENYGYKPTDTVRSFGQVIGHVADSQYMFCSIVRGEKNPAPSIEKTKTSKADLIAALTDAFAYCDKAYDGMTDAAATQMVKLHGSEAPKLGVLTVIAVHSVEHYGNLVTYMRMKGIVPPTSDPEFMRGLAPQPKK